MSVFYEEINDDDDDDDERLLTVDGELGLRLVPSDRVLRSTHVNTVIRRTRSLDLQTSIVQNLQPVQCKPSTTVHAY